MNKNNPKHTNTTKETLEQYIARGGRIERVPFAVSSEDRESTYGWPARPTKAPVYSDAVVAGVGQDGVERTVGAFSGTRVEPTRTD